MSTKTRLRKKDKKPTVGMENPTIGDDEINMHEEMRRAFSLPSEKWKLEIIGRPISESTVWGIAKGNSGITRHMLTAQLRELEADGLVSAHRARGSATRGRI